MSDQKPPMTPHDRLTATIKNRLRRLQDWEVADVVKDIEEAGLLAGEWVSVKEGKPRDGDECIVYDPVFGRRWAQFFIEDGEEIFDTYNERDVTHWSKLPQPPQADTGEKE